jgi:UDP-N-acetylglucosamine 4,6-dehydratase
VEHGETRISEATDYNSHNTTRLDVPEMRTLLMKLDFIKAAMHGDILSAEE